MNNESWINSAIFALPSTTVSLGQIYTGGGASTAGGWIIECDNKVITLLGLRTGGNEHLN